MSGDVVEKFTGDPRGGVPGVPPAEPRCPRSGGPRSTSADFRAGLYYRSASARPSVLESGGKASLLAKGNERRVHSGSPAFRRPSIISFAFDWPPRAIHADIVKLGSTSSRRSAASCASPSRPRRAKADARQR